MKQTDTDRAALRRATYAAEIDPNGQVSHQDKADAVYLKMKRVYPALSLPSAEHSSYAEDATDAINSFMEETWKISNTVGKDETLPDQALRNAANVKRLAQSTLQSISTALQISQRIHDLFPERTLREIASGKKRLITAEGVVSNQHNGASIASREIYKKYDSYVAITDLYMDHILVGAFEGFKRFGYSEEQAYRNCGLLIKAALNVKLVSDSKNHIQDPIPYDVRPKKIPEFGIEWNIRRLKSHSGEKKAELEAQRELADPQGHRQR